MVDPIEALRSLSSVEVLPQETRLDLRALGLDSAHTDALLAFVRASSPGLESDSKDSASANDSAVASDTNNTTEEKESTATNDAVEPVGELVLLAIRALGQLEAVEAVPVFLSLLERFPLDEFLGDEVERAWVAMGAGSLLPLSAALLDRERGASTTAFDSLIARYQRITSALGRLADEKDTRRAAVSMLIKAIEPHTPRDIPLVSYAIRTLVGLQEDDAAEAIRGAFLRGDVDEAICGAWAGIVLEMQLKGEVAEPIDEGDGKLRLRLRCTACAAALAYRVARVYVSAKRQTDPALKDWDGVMIPKIIVCRACGALDQYKLSGSSFRDLLDHLEAIEARGGEAVDRPVIAAVSTLWDGTVVTRASQGLDHLRKLAERHTTGESGAEAWRRLGNYCHTIQLGGDEGENAWRKAIKLDENEFEAAHQLAYRLVARGDFSAAGPLLTRVMKLLPTAAFAPQPRWTFCSELMEMLQAIGHYTPIPLGVLVAFEAGTSRGKPIATLSSLDLRAFDRWDSLARFLHLGRIKAMRWAPELSTEPPALLLKALDTFDTSLAPGAEVSPPSESAASTSRSAVSRKWQSASKKKKK